MYRIKIHTVPQHEIYVEYNIPGNIIIFTRNSSVDNELKTAAVGMSVDDLLDIAEIIKTRKGEHSKGIDPPASETPEKGHESYIDEM